eukprot:9500672-Pyramimonas_sp.AAC.1
MWWSSSTEQICTASPGSGMGGVQVVWRARGMEHACYQLGFALEDRGSIDGISETPTQDGCGKGDAR